jgi:LmbE family N-acetylglucosaminyl deacetylase
MTHTHWIFISPHFDDAALSCGGLIWQLTQTGAHVEIWTIMAGFPPDENYSDFTNQIHIAWGAAGREAILLRRQEDQSACQILNASFRHFDWPDAIYRRQENGHSVVDSNATLFNATPKGSLVSEIGSKLKNTISRHVRVVAPISLGGHIDHRAIFEAVESQSLAQAYYADYPYILTSFDDPRLGAGGYRKSTYPLSKAAVKAWQEAVLCYQSQLSGFWRDAKEAHLALNNYQAGGGGQLWKKQPQD